MGSSRHSATIAGTVAGLRMASKSLEPSLMPRSAIDQGLITAGSFATGFLAGAAVAKTVGVLPGFSAPSAVRLVGMVATGVRAATFAREVARKSMTPLDPASAWTETATDLISSTAIAGVSSTGRPGVTVLSAAAVTASTITDGHSALQLRDDDPDAKYLATAAGTAFGAVAAVGSLVALVRVSGHVGRSASGGSGFRGAIGYAAGTAVAAGILAAGTKIALGKVVGSIGSGNKAYEVAYTGVPENTTVTGSTYSLVPFESLGLQGRRLVSVATSASDIETIMGEPARKDPVRVFIGVASAESIDERVELAIQELRRTGGFDRSTIIAASPAGTGYVNYITVEAAELMSLGDVATVAIQYGSLPSMMSMNKVATASDLYAALIARLREEIDLLDRDVKLLAYGESLGAQTGQNGVEQIWNGTELPVDGALWVGTPSGTGLFDNLTGELQVPVFDRPDQLLSYMETAESTPMATYLNHDNDPVASFSPSTFYEMPHWLKKPDRGRGVNPHQRWLPNVAFWQGLIDTKNAATVIPGEFKSTGHDYRADLASFIRVAYRFDDVSDEQMERIEERLRSSEIERSENISLGKVQTA